MTRLLTENALFFCPHGDLISVTVPADRLLVANGKRVVCESDLLNATVNCKAGSAKCTRVLNVVQAQSPVFELADERPLRADFTATTDQPGFIRAEGGEELFVVESFVQAQKVSAAPLTETQDQFHPAPPGVFFPASPAEPVASPSQLHHPNDDELAAAQACAILDKVARRFERWLRFDPDAEAVIRPLLTRTQQAHLAISEDYKPRMTAHEALALGLVGTTDRMTHSLAPQVTPRPQREPVLAMALPPPVEQIIERTSEIIVLVVGSALLVVWQWVLSRPWSEKKSEEAVTRLREAADAPACWPEPTLKAPDLVVVPGRLATEAAPMSRIAVDPLSVVNEQDQERAARIVKLYWPVDYLPLPAGWRDGVVVARSGLPRPKSTPNQDRVRGLVNAAIAFAKPSLLRGDILAAWDSRRPAFEAFLKKTGKENHIPLLDQVPRSSGTGCYHAHNTDPDAIGAFRAHHVVPFYFRGGADTLLNLCVIDADCHDDGHILLRYQYHWRFEDRLPPDLVMHPLTLSYRILLRPGLEPERVIQLRLLAENWRNDPQETDYLDGLGG